MSIMRSLSCVLVLSLGVTGACRNADGDHAAPSGLTKKAVTAEEKAAGPQAIETTYEKMLANRAEREATKVMRVDDNGEIVKDEWVPAEFKAGASKWKDVGVYVDGKPVSFLTWGELPLGLKPTWVEDRVSADKRPGTDDPDTRVVRQRFYRFTDYLKALGVDIRKVKALHVYGPKFTQSNVSTAKDLLSPAAADFTFRFGSNTSGKPIPHVPQGFGNGRAADKIASVMIYVNKKPPTLVPQVGFELDGVKQEAVPYYGDPIRGGVRVYLDDKLAAIIKRQELDAKSAAKASDGSLSWKLMDQLKTQGVDASKVAEVWVIRDELRAEHFPGTDLAAMTFAASSQGKGGILLGDQRIRANAIALHTHPVDPATLPRPTKDDD